MPSPVAAPRAPSHVNNFDGVRLCAALLVIFGHEFSIRGLEQPILFGSHIASLGVKIFFSVSGYLVAQSFERDPQAARFIQRRALRLLPGLVACVLATVLIIGPLFSQLAPGAYIVAPSTRAYLWNLAFGFVETMPGLFEGNPLPQAVNGSLWSLPAEAAMYGALLLAALASCGARGRWTAAMAALFFGAVAAVCLFAVYGWSEVFIYGTRLSAFCVVASFFCAGSLLWLLRGALSLRLDYAAAFIAAGLVAQNSILFALIEPIAVSYAALAVCVRGVPGLRDAARGGDFSYGLYLYAYPIQQAVQHSFGANLSFAAALFLSLVATSICAALSWHGVEKHALRLKPVARPSAALALQAAERLASAPPSPPAGPAKTATAH